MNRWLTAAIASYLIATPVASGQAVEGTLEWYQQELAASQAQVASLQAQIDAGHSTADQLGTRLYRLQQDNAAMLVTLHAASQYQAGLSRRLLASQRRYRAVRRSQARLALRVASAATGVSLQDLRTVAWCESRLNPDAVNPDGDATGLLQFKLATWRAYPMGRAGISRRNPYASALQAALIVRQEGWRQWECKP